MGPRPNVFSGAMDGLSPPPVRAPPMALAVQVLRNPRPLVLSRRLAQERRPPHAGRLRLPLRRPPGALLGRSLWPFSRRSLQRARAPRARPQMAPTGRHRSRLLAAAGRLVWLV